MGEPKLGEGGKRGEVFIISFYFFSLVFVLNGLCQVQGLKIYRDKYITGGVSGELPLGYLPNYI